MREFLDTDDLLKRQEDIISASDEEILTAASFLPGAGIPESLEAGYDAGIESATYLQSGHPLNAAFKGIESLGHYSLGMAEMIPGIGAMVAPLKGATKLLKKGSKVGYHGTARSPELPPHEAAEAIEKEGFTGGSSAELKLKGTSMSRDPLMSYRGFSDHGEGMMEVTTTEDLPLHDLRPSDYLLGVTPSDLNATYRKPNTFFMEDELFAPKRTGAQGHLEARIMDAEEVDKLTKESRKYDTIVNTFTGQISDMAEDVHDGVKLTIDELAKDNYRGLTKSVQGILDFSGRGTKTKLLNTFSSRFVEMMGSVKDSMGFSASTPEAKKLLKLAIDSDVYLVADKALGKYVDDSHQLYSLFDPKPATFGHYKKMILQIDKYNKDIDFINPEITRLNNKIASIKDAMKNPKYDQDMIDRFMKKDLAKVQYRLEDLKNSKAKHYTRIEEIQKAIDTYDVPALKNKADNLYRESMRAKENLIGSMKEFIGRSRKQNFASGGLVSSYFLPA